MNAIETPATTMANSRSIEPAVLITADSVFETYKLVTSWIRSFTSVAIPVTVVCTVTTEVAVMFSGIC